MDKALKTSIGVITFIISIIHDMSIVQDNQITRALEYVQSVLVSSESNYAQQEDADDNSPKYHEIVADVIDLQNRIVSFYFVWTAYKLAEDENADNEVLQYIVESQIAQIDKR